MGNKYLVRFSTHFRCYSLYLYYIVILAIFCVHVSVETIPDDMASYCIHCLASFRIACNGLRIDESFESFKLFGDFLNTFGMTILTIIYLHIV